MLRDDVVPDRAHDVDLTRRLHLHKEVPVLADLHDVEQPVPVKITGP
ncbi:MAG TPA: hypothetical protein VF238_05475 [Methylomirabilota bacterium]